MKKIAISKINELLTKIASGSRLYAPQRKAGVINYDSWTAESQVDISSNTVKSVKDIFFPQCENLVEFATSGKNLSITPAERATEQFVVFGVRACDIKSFDILDKVFLVDPIDKFYEARRACGTLVSLACFAPEETCFCQTFGIDPTAPKGDVVTYVVGDMLVWDSKTVRGDTLTAYIGDMLEDADEGIIDAEVARVKKVLSVLPLKDVSVDNIKPEKLQEYFDSKEWESLSSACIGCGSCTYICPTCQCYDVRDYNTGHGVKRYRCWDSCMCNDFTMMAHGTPRVTKMQRFRQRFMHKLVYFPSNNNGEFSCVGCGRCVAKCPVSISIVKVIKTLGGK